MEAALNLHANTKIRGKKFWWDHRNQNYVVSLDTSKRSCETSSSPTRGIQTGEYSMTTNHPSQF